MVCACVYMTVFYFKSFFLIYNLFADIIAYINRIRKLPKFPNEDDLITSAGALLRLQKTYSLTDVTAIANGKFHDFQLG